MISYPILMSKANKNGFNFISHENLNFNLGIIFYTGPQQSSKCCYLPRWKSQPSGKVWIHSPTSRSWRKSWKSNIRDYRGVERTRKRRRWSFSKIAIPKESEIKKIKKSKNKEKITRKNRRSKGMDWRISDRERYLKFG